LIDPEGSRAYPSLARGDRVQGEPAARRGWITLRRNSGPPIDVRVQDAIKARRKSERNLRGAAKHITYEFRMLPAALLRQRTGDPSAYTAWFIHCRNVMAFVENKGHETDDCCAQDYIDDPLAWHAARRSVPLPAPYETYRRAIPKLAAHLTYSRLKYEGEASPRPSEEVTTYLLSLGVTFAGMLSATRLRWFAQHLIS